MKFLGISGRFLFFKNFLINLKLTKLNILMGKEMKTLTETIDKFRSKEFIYDFYIKEGKLRSDETKESFVPEDLIIERTGRYEGDSNPDDMSIIYAITSESGTKGILLDAYGTYADPQISEFIKDVPIKSENGVK
jgi:hypothetical protein